MISQLKRKSGGFTLVELLIVVAIFAIILALSTRSIFLILRGSKKSDSLIKVRENLDYAVSSMERNLRNAKSIECDVNSKQVSYVAVDGSEGSYECVEPPGPNDTAYIASSSARLTNSEVNIINTGCQVFNPCFSGGPSTPGYVVITLKGRGTNASGTEGSEVTVSTRVNLRTY